MAKGAPVWITRAHPGAEATAAKVAALGFTPVVDPLLAVAPIAASVDLSGIAAVAFTSVNGVQAFSKLAGARDLPVFTVGRATASAASEAGFSSVSSADGDVADLARLIAAARPGPVLWAGAREPAGDLVAMLNDAGVAARGVAIYETVDRPPSEATLALLDRPLTVLLHSPRAARVLAEILRRRPASALRTLCLSEAVAAPLEALAERGSVAFAPRPDETALLSLLTA
ncbi:uroporphyrinogen-III synthase [Caulobacter segnis]|uniref:Uroporphyrinogen III synthase HEM4 n=2 Tax=Caulobacter segnis TaxID=88688 RepID=D5VDP4_CAUST|nr:uroporphyrinogen-III synthase [Caulobacter segnis]ADG08594.1 Uroporphyrinogen III synthase HEM4 [Caulobacter segnis ATCC 21756]AVQ00445.1 uroporphyrinogen-III synthase [Caulobacter segnis]